MEPRYQTITARIYLLIESCPIAKGASLISFAVLAVLTLFLQGRPVLAAVEFDESPPEAAETGLPVYSWQDKEQNPKAVVLLIHGISQRARSLDALANSLASDGAITYGIDLRGHGWWHHDRDKKDVGFRSDYKASLCDTKKLSRLLKKEHPDLPLILLGESVGAAVAIRAASDLPDEVNGLVLCGGGSKVCKGRLSWIVVDLVKGIFRRPVDVTRYQREFGTDDLIALEETISDPLQRKTFRVREILRAGRFLKKNRKFAKRLDPDIAVLVVQGSDDHTLTTKSAKKVFCDIPGADKKLVVVPNCGHILIGTPRPKEIVTDSIVTFVDQISTEKVAGTDNSL